MRNALLLAILGGSVLLGTATVKADLMLVETTQPAGTTSFANAVGTFNNGNNKARLEAAGQTTLQGGNPANGWYSGDPRPIRSWDVSWNNSAGTVTFNVYSSSDWTGPIAMTMTRTPVFAAGNTIVGIDIGARLTDPSMSVKLDSIQFDGNGGFNSWVDVDTAEATYSGNQFFNDYHGLLNGPLTDFNLRGTAQFLTGTTTGDSMRFFVNLRQGAGPIPSVPDGGTMLALLGVSLAGLAGLRRKLA